MSERLRRVVARLDPQVAERWLVPGGRIVSEFD
jgi:hypothetical protein